MTTADPQHVRAGGVGRTWRSFRRWRRSRPFWGGLFTALAGAEMFASTKMTLNGLSFHSGSTGLYSLLIPIILVTCGLLLWFSPAQRIFYSIVAAVTTVYSLIGLNLGGFFLGLLLGMVGSALAFAWTPTARPAPTPLATDAPTGDPTPEPPSADDGSLVDELMPAEGRGVPRQRDDAPPTGTERPGVPGGGRDPHYFAVALALLGLSAGALTVVRPTPVQAAPVPPAASACPTPPTGATKPAPTAGPTRATRSTPSASATAGGGTSTPAASPSPSPTSTSDGNILTEILHGIGDLFTGGRQAEPTASPSASPSPSGAGRPATSATPVPTTTRPGLTGRSGRAAVACPPAPPTRSRTVQPGKLMPKLAPEPGQPKVAQRPSKLTGSKVTMTGLRFDGIVELPTANGTLKVLKFSMAKAVTDDFKLVADGPVGRSQQYVTDRLTVQGDVAFYATRFVGRLLGIKITLTPDLPFPDGIPITSPIPITFTDPAIDLAFVDSDTLTARPALELRLA
ncbi:DUF6114 domain-containing protein [Micromonospora sp. CPCC 205711]|uniref:DUF6114 domain-containing protein n=1 Tax=Micromonospora sp. CPCC 205547 TaxID=3122400 RepID=UPI002FF1118B